MKYVMVLFSHVPASPDPLKLKRGERVKLGKKDGEWPGWIWGETESGKSGWIPVEFLIKHGPVGELNRDYDATELNVNPGERLRVLGEVAGWYWCEAPGNLQGWVPVNKVKE